MLHRLRAENAGEVRLHSTAVDILECQPVISLVILDQMLTADEVAQMLRITRATLYKLVKEGKIPGWRVGTDLRFSLEAIEKWMQEAEHTS
jgi:excisionase family DNA binding protein